MDALFAYVLIAVVMVIVSGCLYAACAVLCDLAAGWNETLRAVRIPKQYGIGWLFTLTTVVAIASFFLQGVQIDNVGQALVMSAVSLAWSAAIVYAFQCMVGEWRRRPPLTDAERHEPNLDALARLDDNLAQPPANDDPPVELERWLSACAAGEPARDDLARPASTAAVRSHFRVHLAEDPKGVKFGRV